MNSENLEENSVELSPGAKEWLTEHLRSIERKIVHEAQQKIGKGSRIEPMDLAIAAQKYAPGNPFPGERELSWRERLTSAISGVTVVSAILAVVFAGMAFILLSYEKPPEDVSAWFDISKIFAGAVVGSTGAATIASFKREAS